jgi:hypothetical protein
MIRREAGSLRFEVFRAHPRNGRSGRPCLTAQCHHSDVALRIAALKNPSVCPNRAISEGANAFEQGRTRVRLGLRQRSPISNVPSLGLTSNGKRDRHTCATVGSGLH